MSAPYARWQGVKCLTSPPLIRSSAESAWYPRATVEAFRPAGNVRNRASRFRQPRLQPRVALFLSGFAMVDALRQTGCSKLAPTLCRDLDLVQRFTCKSAQNREPTSGLKNRLPLLQLRVISHVLQGFAGGCKSRISKRVYRVRFAGCCTVLRSRWYQSGIRRRWITRSGFLFEPHPRPGYEKPRP